MTGRGTVFLNWVRPFAFSIAFLAFTLGYKQQFIGGNRNVALTTSGFCYTLATADGLYA